jgi:hypothetical protein
MPLFDVTYHSLLSEKDKQSYHQTPDQACMAIGDAVVAGFKVQRYAFNAPDDTRITVVTTTSPHDVLFGAYEFTRMV